MSHSSVMPDTDRGAVELDVLRYWRKTGIGGTKIDAFMALEPKNHLHVQAASSGVPRARPQTLPS